VTLVTPAAVVILRVSAPGAVGLERPQLEVVTDRRRRGVVSRTRAMLAASAWHRGQPADRHPHELAPPPARRRQSGGAIRVTGW
jgi:hypothetical protein